MKRGISLLLISLSIIPLLAEAYNSEDKASSEFKLRLNKTGTNVIWFSEDEEGNIFVPDNRHIFPLVKSSTEPIKSTIYFHWKLDDTESSVVSLSFVSSDMDYQNSKYMLENMSPSVSAEDMNSDVIVTSLGTGTSIIKSIKNSGENSTGTLLNERTLSDMTIELNPTEKEKHFKVEMTICPAYRINEGDFQFMEAQYTGYIVAELKYN